MDGSASRGYALNGPYGNRLDKAGAESVCGLGYGESEKRLSVPPQTEYHSREGTRRLRDEHGEGGRRQRRTRLRPGAGAATAVNWSFALDMAGTLIRRLRRRRVARGRGDLRIPAP